ncbi:hypothetical protein KAJ71_00235 [Serratia sp. arafor3]|uniref:Phage integrase central domain-containing protein n=1 Tax=Serratia silvae TaxID=2824122 RepID=A0ABT0K622_9GAMM|nr:hypothetical protein [Serratia silvae]
MKLNARQVETAKPKDKTYKMVDSGGLYLELYIFPYIGSSDIRQFKTSHLLAPIKKVDASGKHDVAQRLQQRVTAIMRYAVQNDYIDSNSASDMAGGAIDDQSAALPSSRFPEFFA